ncbi:DUF1837 domain-containing protein [Pseudomonas entomophila]|uniref:HamA C-terminal domain-containing protein n=1 Tax=Pseudomonas entomophila TaxID=312306 RepID=UPI0023D7D2F1|nr:DUF1837 domain-containing protein [Pseudomonas entomophila]MDF0731692.1 DUF1837 domain-containing protein [Pseudomonas entomophila]
MTGYFGSREIIQEIAVNDSLRCFFVGYDLADDTQNGQYRWKDFVNVLVSAVHEFAFGMHEGSSVQSNKLVVALSDAAKSIYKIEDFSRVKDIYLSGGHLDDDLEDKYLRRGEFGELLLHLILRDNFGTIPLLSKIYFKDSYGHTVHGFDSVHINPETKSLWLGESKLYMDPFKGVAALVKDLGEHIRSDYMADEFSIISKKIKHFSFHEDVEYWTKWMSSAKRLKEKLTDIYIPMLCTYSCETFSTYDDEVDAFKKELVDQARAISKKFHDGNNHAWKSKINIVLILLPVKCKKELVKRLHQKLGMMQVLGD